MPFETPEDRSYLVDLSDGVLRFTINRPEHGNAVKPAMVTPITELFRDAAANDAVRAILIRGEGPIFSAGGDVQGFAPTLEWSVEQRQEEFRGRISRLGRLVEAVTACRCPIVVALRGAVAGASMVYPLAADAVVADPSAMFVFAHMNVGLSPDGGLSALLPRVVGERAARYLILTGARVKAEEALRLGLVNLLVEAEALDEKAEGLARRLASAPQRAARTAKRLVASSPERTLAEQLQAEIAGIVECVAEEDFREGVSAFLEKRKPSFPSAGEAG